MNKLLLEIAERIRETVSSRVGALRGDNVEWRAVFHGPPKEFLFPIFEELALEGGIAVVLADKKIVVPVLLQTDRVTTNPPIGESGECTTAHLLNLRNSPKCSFFVALIPPGNHTNLSFSSASDEFGITSGHNSGNSTIQQWWQDDFIQSLVEAALKRLLLVKGRDSEQARSLIEEAVLGADEAELNDVHRIGAWQVLSRVFDIPSESNAADLLSLACGFPPTGDGGLDSKAQVQIINRIGDFFEESGFKTGIVTLKERDPELSDHLDDFENHLREKCEIHSVFARSPAFYYSPNKGEVLSSSPEWWRGLTLENWIELLEETVQPEGALTIECTNAIFPPQKGGYAVVHDQADFRISTASESSEHIDAKIVRHMGGGKSNFREWDVRFAEFLEHSDDAIPNHRAAIRYAVDSPDCKVTSIKVISLASWEPGFVVACRNARKVAPPKRITSRKSAADFETTLVLSGSGRHYIDIYTSPGVILDTTAKRIEEDELVDVTEVDVSRVDDSTWALEAEVDNGCFYELVVTRGEIRNLLRIALICDDAPPEGCQSEFERLIKLNRQGRGRATMSVIIDRNVRCSDLETWLIDSSNVDKSFYPLVLSNDYDLEWRKPTWTGEARTIFSQARFLHDPRPTFEDFTPPPEFLENRALISAKIRGSDDSGLVESATLGEWIASDENFAAAVERYLHSYALWLETEPNIASWVDTIAVCGLEGDGTSLKQEPDAVILNPLHPVRLAWQAVAQKALFASHRKMPCPAASILNPDQVPDKLTLPLLTATGAISHQAFLSVECSSDYWGILWNGRRLDSLPNQCDLPPFDDRFGVRIGGLSSGFSFSQVRRALDDVSEMLPAKPEISIMISKAKGQTEACNEGIIDWCRNRLGKRPEGLRAMGPRFLQVFDLRSDSSRPEDATICNLTEDTANAVKWFAGERKESSPDLGIIAQLEVSNPKEEPVEHSSPLGWGGLVRHRIRRQLSQGEGAFISESRGGSPGPASGNGLADKLAFTIAKIENVGSERLGLLFAPSVPTIREMLERADFAAVSSSVVDPACFLGTWLPGYLWDYDLPSYSQRAGDTNGYYLLAKIKDSDREALHKTLERLPNVVFKGNEIDALLLEVARRGIPTVRGLASGNHGASGDLGLLVASRLLQDAFRESGTERGLLPVFRDDGESFTVTVIVPVDPFRGYIEDLQRAVGSQQFSRPDLLVMGINISPSGCRIKITPVEVKFRTSQMPPNTCLDALSQASALSKLLNSLLESAKDPELVIWRLALEHLLCSMLGFAFRVYSQQKLAAHQSRQWTEIHAQAISAVLSGATNVEVDEVGRLIVIDRTTIGSPKDFDEDSFQETIVLSFKDAAEIIQESEPSIYGLIKESVADWGLLPRPHTEVVKESSISEPVDVVEPIAPYSIDPHEEKVDSNIPQTESEDIPVSSSSEDLTASSETSSADQAPSSLRGIEFCVGESIEGFRKEKMLFNPSNTDLNHLNIGVVGDLGTGKTQLLKTLIFQIVNNPENNRGIRPRFLIFDYKKDYSSPDFVNAVGAKVIKPQHLPVNLFDRNHSGDSLTPWLDRFNFFSDVLDKIYSNIGPVQRRQLKAAVKQAYDASGPEAQPTIYDVQKAYALLMGDKPDSPSSILEDIVDREIFLRDPVDAGSLREFLDGVVVLDLASLGQDDRAKNMVVAIMLNVFYEQMLRIPKRRFEGAKPQLRAIDSFLLVDEADNIMRFEFDVLRKILLQGREFGVGVILASQYLRHFKAGATDYRDPLLTWFVHKVPNVTASEIQALGIPSEASQIADQIKTLQKHCCLYKTSDAEPTIINGVPFYTLDR